MQLNNATRLQAIRQKYRQAKEQHENILRNMEKKKSGLTPKEYKSMTGMFQSPPEHPKDKSGLDASAKLTRAELNKRSGDADLSKDKSGPESPPEFRRSWYVEGHIRSGVISSVLAQRHLRNSPTKGDEGPSSGGTKLNSTFITAKVTFTKRKQPT
ncbi:hypothetical protein Tco_1254351 [Tanacetum coccineum]